MALAHTERVEGLIVQNAVGHNEGLGASWKTRRAFWTDRRANEGAVRENHPRLLVIWGKYDPSFDSGEPERYRKDVPDAEVHIVDAGHISLPESAGTA